MKYFLHFVLCLSFVGLISISHAQESTRFSQEQLDEIGKLAHSNLAQAKTIDGHLIGEEKAKTLVYPLIPYDLMEFVIIRGTLAGFAEYCELDWEGKYYVPLMQGLRNKQKDFTDYQWAFIGMLHGTAMGSAERSRMGQPCDGAFKQGIEKAALR